MLTVACVLSDGPTYKREHVERLRGQVADHLSQSYEFVCVDDSPLSGWWAKISLFEPGRFTGRVLYLDLDVTVVGALDDIADFPAPFAAIKDYQYPMTINSSVMSWTAGVADHVYAEFDSSVPDRYPGDQNWINNRIPRAVRFPRQWCVSYKQSTLSDYWPEDMRVCVYHGFPKPWKVKCA